MHSNSYNYKSTFSVEIVPICKVGRGHLCPESCFPYTNCMCFDLTLQDNVVCLSPHLAQSMGNMGQVCVCVQVTSTVHLIDPRTLQSEYIQNRTDVGLDLGTDPCRDTHLRTQEGSTEHVPGKAGRHSQSARGSVRRLLSSSRALQS